MRLVKAALTQAQRMQRDRHDDIAASQQRTQQGTQQRREGLRQIVAGLPLQAHQRFGQGTAIFEGRVYRR
jgi:hypothetical protein